ncbi:MAG TPA: metallophosphoesterase [Acidimicrobiia bacterium]|jgi:3',5'-cyclic AMP phosphodiesterase CpdA|nr:metallophosphoesterase [Acidimicrobiia bacterium]
MSRDSFLVAQLSDIHCGSPFFDPQLLRHAVEEVRAVAPDLVLIGGDLTTDGYAHEFRDAQNHLDPLVEAQLTTVVIPGNHDAKNVGYLHFVDSFGPGDVPGKGDRVLHLTDSAGQAVTLVAMDSTKPDLAEGEIGRERYSWIRQQFSPPADLRIFALHHHLVPVPGTGRERNTVWDSGDVLALLGEVGVNVVLSGHKHVPFVWLLNDLLVVNSGTVSSHRLRGYVRPSYNLLEITRDRIVVTLRYPGTGERQAAELDRLEMRLHPNPELAGMFAKSAWHA